MVGRFDWVGKMVVVFRAVRRVLRKAGTVWLNLGDSHAGGKRGGSLGGNDLQATNRGSLRGPVSTPFGVKKKDLIGMPWLVAFALRADGWWLRSDIIWSKPNPMPESATDRPTRAHEYLFLLTRSARYWYNAAAIRQPYSIATRRRVAQPTFAQQLGGPKDPGTGNRSHRKALQNLRERLRKGEHWKNRHWGWNGAEFHSVREGASGANKRTVWEIPTAAYRGAHFATFPPKLVEPCILAGCPPGGIVLDPFCGTATTGQVAIEHGRRFIGIDLDPKSIRLATKRMNAVEIPLIPRGESVGP